VPGLSRCAGCRFEACGLDLPGCVNLLKGAQAKVVAIGIAKLYAKAIWDRIVRYVGAESGLMWLRSMSVDATSFGRTRHLA